jgi:predicted protein tyrosine phosphatase
MKYTAKFEKMYKQKLLFICSRNQWRSPTAELLFKNHLHYHARSAGTSEKARIKVNQKLVDWSDKIIVMERKHKAIIQTKFTSLPPEKPIIVLEIEDLYTYNDPELIELLQYKLSTLLDIHLAE